MINNLELLDLVKEPSKDINAYIEIRGNKFNSLENLRNLKINSQAEIDGIWVGRSIPKMLSCEIINVDNININKGDIVKAYIGMRIDSSKDYIYQVLGSYKIHSFEEKEDKRIIGFTAYDKLKEAQEIKYANITYPISVSGILDIIQNKLEISLDRENVLFKDYLIREEIFFGKEKTINELINAVSQMSVTFAYIDYENILRFKRPRKTDYILSLENTFKLRLKNFQNKYNSVVLSRQPQNDDVALKINPDQAQTNELKISNNPILDINREFFISKILDTVKSLDEYNGLENLSLQVNPLLEIGDIVTIKNKNVAILEHTITFTRSEISSKIAEKSETDYKKAKGIQEQILNTQLYVDKVKGEIVAEVNEIKTDNQGLQVRFSTFQQQTSEAIKSKVSQETYDNNNDLLDERFTQISQEANSISIHVGEKIKQLETSTNNKIASSINLAMESIEINSSNIKLEGYTTINGGFKVDHQGNIEAKSGRIAGFSIDDYSLTSNNGGFIRLSSHPKAGYVLGFGPSDKNINFSVDRQGKITAFAGLIAGFEITENEIQSNTNGGYIRFSSNPKAGFAFGLGPKINELNFLVLRDGTMVAKKASIEGKVTAKSGKIGGFEIADNYISGPNGFRLASASGYNPLSTSNTQINTEGKFWARNGTFAGSSSGYGNFSSGSFTGGGYLSSGSSIAGFSMSKASGHLLVRGGIGSTYVSSETIYFTKLESNERSSSGYKFNARLINGAWKISNSDIRLKTDIEELDHEFDKYIYEMPLIKYRYTSDKEKTPRVGVNANLLMKTLPEYMARSFLHKDKISGLYGANYELIVPFLIKTIQDLNNRLKQVEGDKK